MSKLSVRGLLFGAQVIGLIQGCGGDIEPVVGDGGAFGAVGAPSPLPDESLSSGGASNEDIARCNVTTLSGTLEGTAIDRHYPSPMDNALVGSYGDTGLHTLESALGTQGRAQMSWAGNFPLGASLGNSPGDLPGTVTHDAIEASLTLPSELGRDDRYLCVSGPSTIALESNYYLRTYRGVGFLPDCSRGTPVGGALDLCLSVGGDCPRTVSGSIADKTYGNSGWDAEWSDTYVTIGMHDLAIRAAFVATSNTTATVTNAWLRDPATGDVYCAGTASSAEVTSVPANSSLPSSTTRVEVYLRDLRRVGNCTDVKGSDTLEVRSCIDT